MGISKSAISSFSSELFEGMNRQIFNTPIDLFIEDLLYKEFPELRPYQFLSLFALIQEGLKAVTDKRSIELSPKEILSKSKVLNLVNAIQYKDLYGIDFIADFKASPTELKQAQELFEEYLEYRADRDPAEEYELVQHWAEDLKLDKNFDLVSETEFRNRSMDTDKLLESIENDPYDLESEDPKKKQETDQFLKSQKEIGTNMAVAMYMVDALKYFDKMPIDKVRKIAYEIALAGTLGFRPEGNNYNVKSIPGKIFTGYHILAYYYVSWMLSEPNMVSDLQLPYDGEYQIALGFMKRQGGE